MKKLVCILAVGLVLSSLALDARRLNVSSLCSTIREYRFKDGFETVSIGRVGLSVARAAIRAEADGDPEVRLASDLVRDIRKVIVVDFESARERDRAAFCADMERHLRGSEVLMEVNDSDEHISIYGVLSADGSTLSDLVVYGQSGVLVVISGRIPMDSVGALVQECC